ncbi:hypothetical protein HMPREF1870_01728 [Bacteroidales bacterium KA00344]|nr:hypothetical protein HMPREF1870_01728 [Bacteroidales bacterium KA00344]
MGNAHKVLKQFDKRVLKFRVFENENRNAQYTRNLARFINPLTINEIQTNASFFTFLRYPNPCD